MPSEYTRWDAEADVLAAAWTDGVNGEAVELARVERDGDRSYVRARYADEQWARAEVPATDSLRITAADDWWREVDASVFTRPVEEHERRRHDQEGGVQEETLGNFWLGLDEGIVQGTPLPPISPT